MTATRSTARRRRPWQCAALLLSACVSRTEVFENIDDIQEPEPTSIAECQGEPFECFPALAPLSNVVVETRSNTALVSFAGVPGAVDYRVYELPEGRDIRVNAAGGVVVDNAVYRCAGERSFLARPQGNSVSGDVGGIYSRTERDSTLGHVYLSPGTGRVAVFRVADPRSNSDNEDAPPAVYATRSTRFVTPDVRDELLAEGYRDDGVAFYAPTATDGTHAIEYWQSAPRPLAANRRLSVYLAPGDEREAFAAEADPEVFEEVFRANHEPGDESVPLRRVLYEGGHDHDVLAAGQAQFDRVLEQGNQAVWQLSWPMLDGPTTLVVEALDAGCPFLGHLQPDNESRAGLIRVSDAALEDGELFVNGQRAASNRPDAIARSQVDVSPEPITDVDTFFDFDASQPWTLSRTEQADGSALYENAQWSIEAVGDTEPLLSPLFGELWASVSNTSDLVLLRLSPKLELQLSAAAFLHVRFSTSLVVTERRFVQLLLSTATAPVTARLEEANTVIVQLRANRQTALGPAVEPQLQLCRQQPWAPDDPCPQAPLYGRVVGDAADTRPWSPLPVLGELAGYDLPVLVEMFASTERVYLMIDGRPAGCAVLPDGVFDEGAVSVTLGMVSDATAPDAATQAMGSHRFLRTMSPERETRRFDAIGLTEGAQAPNFDEALVPCGTSFE